MGLDDYPVQRVHLRASELEPPGSARFAFTRPDHDRLHKHNVSMDGAALVPDDVPNHPPPPPTRLYERLRQIAGYTWDESISPFHSTYDFW